MVKKLCRLNQRYYWLRNFPLQQISSHISFIVTFCEPFLFPDIALYTYRYYSYSNLFGSSYRSQTTLFCFLCPGPALHQISPSHFLYREQDIRAAETVVQRINEYDLKKSLQRQNNNLVDHILEMNRELMNYGNSNI